MESFWLFIATAFSMVFVIEGLLYALFPDFIRRMMAMAVTMPVSQLRAIGAAMAVTGFCLIWILRLWAGH